MKCSVFNDLTAIISVEIFQDASCSAGFPIGCCLEFKPKFKLKNYVAHTLDMASVCGKNFNISMIKT